MTESELAEWLVEHLAEACFLEPADIEVDAPMDTYGLSSRDAVSLAGELEDLLDTELPSTLMWDHPTVAKLAAALTGTSGSEPETVAPQSESPADSEREDAVAVVGLGCRFPGGADSPAKFWSLLTEGRDGIGQVPDGRWDSSAATTTGGFLEGIDKFDASYFSISPGEARRMDPQQRMLLEVTSEALQHAAIAPEALRGTKTGVYVGISGNEYGHAGLTDPAAVDAWSATGAALSIAANRVSYALDLRGPSMSVDTACSSSLVAVHQAVRALRDGEVDAALVGGTNLLLGPSVAATFDQMGISSPSGKCRPFSADADGIVRSEGCGVVVLKRLSQARVDGDRVLAVIAGSAVNSDGRSNGLTAPNFEAQQDVLRAACADAAIEPSAVDYVEAHGTGTLLGDPIEARSLGSVLGAGRDEALLLGSVKSNLGHLESAAGIAGLIKVVLSLWHGVVPPSINYAGPNPHVDFAALGIEVADRARELRAGATAGVSGFGFGGTNAHVLVRQAETLASGADHVDAPHRLLLGESSSARLTDLAASYADVLAEGTVTARDLVYTSARRLSGTHRTAVVAANARALGAGLRSAAAGERSSESIVDGWRVVSAQRVESPGAVWVFSGQGSQWASMGTDLIAREQAFADTIAELEPLIERECGFSLREVITSATEPTEVAVVQPVLFAMQVALAAVWRSHGHEPDAVLGHSMGEVAAAVVSGALTLAEGARVVALRSRLLGSTTGQGCMAILELGHDEVVGLVGEDDKVGIASWNSPDQTVISGATDQVEHIVAEIEARGLLAKLIKVAAPAHSAVLDPLLPELHEGLGSLRPQTPRIRCYRTAVDDARTTIPFDEHYWVRNFREPVRFTTAVQTAVEDGFRCFVEVSPHPVLTNAVRDVVGASTTQRSLVLGSVRRCDDPVLHLHAELASLELAGLVNSRATGAIVDLPNRAWRRASYWARTRSSNPGHPLLGTYVRMPDGKTHVWQQNQPPAADEVAWLSSHLGVAEYIDMAIAAARTIVDGADDTVLLTEVRLARPLPVGEPAAVCTTAVTEGRRTQVTVTSRVGGAPARVHATLDITTESPATRSNPGGTVTDLTGGASSRGRWTGKPERLTAAFEGPVSAVDSVRCTGDLATITGAVRAEDTVWLVDDSGAAVLELTGVHYASARSEPVALQEKLFGITWSRAAVPAGSTMDSNVVILGEDDDPRVAESAGALRDAGATVTVARAGDALETVPDKVVCWIPAGKSVERGPDALDSVRAVVRTLVEAGAEHTRLWLATSGAVAPLGTDPVDPVAGAIRATARVLGYEHPELTASWLDVLAPADVADELAAEDAADEVAWRDGQRYVAAVSAVDVPVSAGAPSVVRPDGAYVVTGGLGGIGLKMGRWLAEAGARRLVLNGRSAPSEDAAAVIEAMRAEGTEVLVERGDIAEFGTAQRLVAAAGDRLRGVVHAAAVIDDKVTLNVDAELIERVWRPKAIGAWNLHVATERSSLDFWLGFSSVVSLLGYPGHPAYSYANSFVDGLVAHRRSLGLPGTAINWGSWAEVGQAADRGMSIRGMAPTDPVENVEAIEAVLRAGMTNIGVLRPIGSELLELAEDLVDIPFFAELVGVAAAQQGNDWPGVEALFKLPAEQAQERLSERVQRKVAGIMGLSADGFDRHTALTSLGVDSLVAVRIRNSVQHDFDVVLPPALLLRGASLSEMDGWLSEKVLGERGAMRNGVVLVPPRDAAERLVAAVCGSVLGHGVGMTQQLDELTGEENVVEEIAEQLTRRSGHVVTAAELREKRSIERMAELVREQEHPENPLRELRSGDGKAPLFLFHPAGGDTVVYRQLVDQLDPTIGVYGFDRLEGSSTVEERVAVYLPLLREIQPHGPYRVGGWSFGGVLAYEMGRQLAESGEEVELVAMVDTILPLPVPEDMTEVEVMELRFRRFSEFLQTSYGMQIELPYEQMAAASDERQVDLLIETIENTGLINSDVSPAIIRHQRTSYVDALALQRYEPRDFPARVQLYSVSESPDGGMRDPLFDRDDPAKGWDEIRGDDVEIIPMPGHHLSVLDPPHVHVLGAELAAALDRDRSMIH